MATCPRCGGFLDEGHRCRGLWQLRLRVWSGRLVGAILGGSVGFLVLSVVGAAVTWVLVAVAAAIGIIIVMGTEPEGPPASR